MSWQLKDEKELAMQEQKAQGNCPSGVPEVGTGVNILELDQRPTD